MKWVTNAVKDEYKAWDMQPWTTHRQSFTDYLSWRRQFVVGEPKGTVAYSSSDLKSIGMVGHRIRTTPHEFLQGKRCWCCQGRSVFPTDIATLVAAEEYRFANH